MKMKRIISINQAEPEGETEHEKGIIVALVPQNSNYTRARAITTDEDWFWSKPSYINLAQ